jgi:hypothetical protein
MISEFWVHSMVGAWAAFLEMGYLGVNGLYEVCFMLRAYMMVSIRALYEVGMGYLGFSTPAD